jgi:hypothetical protein
MTIKNLSFLLAFACAVPVYASEERITVDDLFQAIAEFDAWLEKASPEEREQFFKDHEKRCTIQLSDWELIKKAVFAKKGNEFASQFNAQYPQPSDAGVRALADQFDACNKYDTWLKICPPLLPIMIGKKEYRLVEGRMTDIIVEYKKHKQK